MSRTTRRRPNTSSKRHRALTKRHCRKDDKKSKKRCEDKRVDKRNIKPNKSPLSIERNRKSRFDSEHRVLYMPDLCPSVAHHEIFHHFGSFGIVEQVKVRLRSKNVYYALIVYARSDSIERAMNANPHQFRDRQYFCRKVRGLIKSSKKHHRPRECRKEEPNSTTSSSNLLTELEYPIRSYLYAAPGQLQSKLWLNNTAEEKTTDAATVWPKSVQILRELQLRESPLLAKKTNLHEYGKHGPATSPKLVKARVFTSLKLLPPPSLPSPPSPPMPSLPPLPTLGNPGNSEMDKSDPCVLDWFSLYENYQFVRHSYVDPTIDYGQEVPIEHQIELTADKYAAIAYLGRKFE